MTPAAACRCGAPRLPWQPFCRACYGWLPARFAMPLRLPAGPERRAAIEAAAAFLETDERRRAVLTANGHETR